MYNIKKSLWILAIYIISLFMLMDQLNLRFDKYLY